MVTALIGLLSGIAGAVGVLVAARYSWLKNDREQAAADDRESDRLLTLKDMRIAELAARVDGLQLAVNDLREQIRAMERQVDVYGCRNGPTCVNRRPLGGPRPEGSI